LKTVVFNEPARYENYFWIGNINAKSLKESCKIYVIDPYSIGSQQVVSATHETYVVGQPSKTIRVDPVTRSRSALHGAVALSI